MIYLLGICTTLLRQRDSLGDYRHIFSLERNVRMGYFGRALETPQVGNPLACLAQCLAQRTHFGGGCIFTMTGPVLDAEGSTWSMPSRGSQPDGDPDK